MPRSNAIETILSSAASASRSGDGSAVGAASGRDVADGSGVGSDVEPQASAASIAKGSTGRANFLMVAPRPSLAVVGAHYMGGSKRVSNVRPVSKAVKPFCALGDISSGGVSWSDTQTVGILLNEQEAISRLKQGDITGLETLVETYQVHAVRTAYLVTHDRHLAQDVVQTAFLRVFDRRRQFDASRPFGPWFLRIVVNDAIKAVSRRDREVSLDERMAEDDVALGDLLPDSSPGPEELAEQAEVRQAVWAALERLPPTQRASVVLHYYLGLKQEEIAERTGRAPGTIKWRLHAARERLRSLLGTVNLW